MKFVKGNVVKRKDGQRFTTGDLTLTVQRQDMFGVVFFEENGLSVGFRSLDLVEEDTLKHHKHHDVIVAYAKGEKIQLRKYGTWVNVRYPTFENVLEYRVKPNKSERELEIERIEKAMHKLADDLFKLKGERNVHKIRISCGCDNLGE